MAAEPTVKLYHGTNIGALGQIREAGEFLPQNPRVVVGQIEELCGLAPGAIWNHPHSEFSRGRVGDPRIYFTCFEHTAGYYARGGSEVIRDASAVACHLLCRDELVDAEDNYRPDARKKIRAWVESRAQAHFPGVVLTVAVPWEKLRADVLSDTHITYDEWMAEHNDWPAVALKAPIPARWIVHADTVTAAG